MIGNSGCPALDIECPGAADPNPPADWTNAPHDIMSYGPCFKYISPRNWIRLFNAFTGSNWTYPKNPSAPNPGTGAEKVPVTLAAAPERVETGAPARYLMVRGVENPDGAWVLLPAYEMEYPEGTADATGQGDWSLALLGSEGQELFVRRLTPLSGHVDQGEPRTAVAEPPSFAELMPLPDGVASPAYGGTAVASLELRHGGETLASVTRSAHVPSVTIAWPTAFGFQGQPGGPRAVWSGSDADGDDLHYLVQYTRGAQGQNPPEWQNLAGDLTAQELGMDPTTIPGGTGCMVRVLATDGLNTGVATSPAFALAGKPPVVSISSPVSGTTVLEGGSLPLRGAARDVEDGAVTGDRLSWRSDRDGPLGTGNKLEVSGLSPGVHRITLQARDSHNMTGTATVTITVAERTNAQPVADAGPDRWTAVGRAVALDGSRSADADGDALSFEWSVVSGPTGGTGRWSDPGAMQPGFLADRPGDYRLELMVYDGEVSSFADAVVVHVTGDAGWRTYLPAIVKGR